MATSLADGLGPRWPVETIPDGALLYMRVHEADRFPNGEIRPGAFRNRRDPARPEAEQGMSTFWNAYATSAAVRAQARQPGRNFVIVMEAGRVRAIPGQRLQHTPIQRPPEDPNRGHSDVFGPKTNTRERLLFLEIAWPVE